MHLLQNSILFLSFFMYKITISFAYWNDSVYGYYLQVFDPYIRRFLDEILVSGWYLSGKLRLKGGAVCVVR